MDDELRGAVDEYNAFFHKLVYHSEGDHGSFISCEIASGGPKGRSIKNRAEIYCCENGWFVRSHLGTQVPKESDLFPTFESLAMSLSPDFERQWHEKLLEKLAAIR
ncbi:unnamed protein product [Kuraishia capsulata CBS 1993]|uniref:GSKIP domain-containing protein n=1 Tax=Kuraishia capsulata CBS 1993 TaxID=1382522 RepID=W6MU11_9ASCO|nr:uncharacterized protein KUCA_T00001339001 [Kuraishia capsulata CBS 1993]CDK25370.1 unnamed protein product [Kuraishia capsulata CBS 1993]